MKKHPQDLEYEFNKRLVDTFEKSLIPHIKYPRQTFANVGAKGPLFHTYRRGLEQHKTYLAALEWVHTTNGPCSFFIRGYKWPWHTRRDYVGILIPTSAAPRKNEKR